MAFGPRAASGFLVARRRFLKSPLLKGMLTMIDLRTIGKRYRLEWDASRQGREQDPWLLRIPCTKGHISPHGETTLAVYLERRPITTENVVSQVPGAKIHQRGDHEVSIVFEAEHLDAVAKIVGARTRRRLLEAHKQALVAGSINHRFKSTVLEDVA